MQPNATIPANILLHSCVYGWRRGKKYLYIGQSISLIRRLKHHHKVEPEDKDKIDIWFCCQSELLNFERAMIKKYNPEYNFVRDKDKYSSFKEAFKSREPSPKKWRHGTRYNPV